MNFITSLFTSAIRLGTTLLFGSTGEIVTEKSGHLNLGIPGIMCVGAAFGMWGGTLYYGAAANPNMFLATLIPMLFAIFGAGLMGALYSFFAVTLRSNQNVTGLMITTFGVGLGKFIKTQLGEKSDTAIGAFAPYYRSLFPFADKLGWFGEMFFSYSFLVYFAIAVALVVAYVMKKTRVGLHLRAVGENPATADAAGINVTRYRYIATIIGSAIAGIGGFFFIFDKGAWDSGLVTVEALGWLSVALVIFTIWKTDFAILGAIVFGALYILPNKLNVSFAMREIIEMLPYFVTIVVLVFTSMRKKKENQPPASLGLPYFREER